MVNVPKGILDFRKGKILALGEEIKIYRKKPVKIEAFECKEAFDIETLEGTMHANVGDYVIFGVEGEVYPCKPSIFKATYEAIKDVTEPPLLVHKKG